MNKLTDYICRVEILDRYMKNEELYLSWRNEIMQCLENMK